LSSAGDWIAASKGRVSGGKRRSNRTSGAISANGGSVFKFLFRQCQLSSLPSKIFQTQAQYLLSRIEDPDYGVHLFMGQLFSGSRFSWVWKIAGVKNLTGIQILYKKEVEPDRFAQTGSLITMRSRQV